MNIDTQSAYFSLKNANKPTQVGGPFVPENKKLWQQAKALEAQFSKLMMEELKKAMPQGSGAPGGTVYADMLVDAVADKLADTGSVGLGKTIYIDMQRAADREEAKKVK